MKKLLFIALFSFLMLSCVDKKKEKNEVVKPETIETVKPVEVEKDALEVKAIEEAEAKIETKVEEVKEIIVEVKEVVKD